MVCQTLRKLVFLPRPYTFIHLWRFDSCSGRQSLRKPIRSFRLFLYGESNVLRSLKTVRGRLIYFSVSCFHANETDHRHRLM